MSVLAAPREFAATTGIPEIPVESVGDCAVCGGGRFDIVAQGRDYELLTCRNLWFFARCRDCGHLQLDPRPAIGTLPTIYPPNYYSYDLARSVGPIAMAGKAFLDRRKFRAILRHARARPRSFLDIGCGDLRYLEVMRRFGVPPERLYGLELDERVVHRANDRGYRVFNERVETATSIPDGSIDLATMFHVIEHVADPAAVVRRIAGWLAPGGLLVLETPNFGALDARLFRRSYWGGYHIPRHWHIFTRDSMQRLLECNGFDVEAVSFQTGHSFWLYSLHHLIRYNRALPCPKLAQLFHPLKSLPMLVLATGFDMIRAKLGIETSAMLLIARRRPDRPGKD